MREPITSETALPVTANFTLADPPALLAATVTVACPADSPLSAAAAPVFTTTLPNPSNEATPASLKVKTYINSLPTNTVEASSATAGAPSNSVRSGNATVDGDSVAVPVADRGDHLPWGHPPLAHDALARGAPRACGRRRPGNAGVCTRDARGSGLRLMVTGGAGRILEAERPALMLLDPVMPDGDGIELMTTVSAPALLPVIFISVYGRDETIARALEADADADADAEDYLVNPFSATELTARVRAALRWRAEPPRARALPAGQARRPPRQAGVHLQQTRRRLPHADARCTVLALHG